MLKRYLILTLVSVIAIPLFYLSRVKLDPMHSWNRAFADLSFIFLLIILFLGALARLNNRFIKWVVWRKELGIWVLLLSVFHVIIFLDGWIEWDFKLLFYDHYKAYNIYFLNHGFGMGNALGIIAFVYVLKLAIISNNTGKKMLSASSWSYIQQSTSVFYLLVSIHAAYFLFFHFSTLERPDPPVFWFNMFFLISVPTLYVFRLVVFWYLVKKNRRSLQSSFTV